MSSSSSVNCQCIEERDAIELYFACVTACSLDDEGVELFNECIELWIENKQSVLLVTHNIDYITQSNYDILYLKNKKISS